MGTLHNGLAAASIYGPDVDILMWDSGELILCKLAICFVLFCFALLCAVYFFYMHVLEAALNRFYVLMLNRYDGKGST